MKHFLPEALKILLFSHLAHCALIFGSPSLLNEELLMIQDISESNGYPTNIIKRVIDSNIRRFKEP